jgi:uncharacterized protein (DUF736 family)
MIVGKFTSVEDGGYVGLILAPGGVINPVRVMPVAGKGVDYIITVDGHHGFDLGVAWNRHSTKTGKAYLSVKLDTPFLPAPINCALIGLEDDSDELPLVWSRKTTAAEEPVTA